MAQKFTTAAVLRGDHLEWTTVQQGKDGLEVAAHGLEPMSEPGEPMDTASDAAAGRVRALHSQLKGSLCLGAPCDKFLLRVAELPSLDPAELRGMAELQVDKFSPFPIEQMAVSMEALQKKESSTLVLIAAAQREAVDALGGLFIKAGFRPHRIDLDLLGWWHLIRESGRAPETGRYLFLLLDRAVAGLIVSENGLPVVFRALGDPPASGEPAALEPLIEEVGYSLTTLEAEWGEVPVLHLSLWHWQDDPAAGALALRLQNEHGLETETQELDSLPPLSEGLVHRSVEAAKGDAPMLDLAPREWGHAEDRRRVRKTLIVATAALVGTWLLAIGAFLAAIAIRRGGLVALKTRVEQLEAPALEARRLSGKIKSFEQYADRTHSAIESLREVTVLLPEGVEFNSFIYKKGGSLLLRGESANTEPVLDFIQALEKSPFFVSAKAEGVDTKTVGDTRRAIFGVTLKLPGEEEKE